MKNDVPCHWNALEIGRDKNTSSRNSSFLSEESMHITESTALTTPNKLSHNLSRRPYLDHHKEHFVLAILPLFIRQTKHKSNSWQRFKRSVVDFPPKSTCASLKSFCVSLFYACLRSDIGLLEMFIKQQRTYQTF